VGTSSSRARETRDRDSRVVYSQIDVDESGDLEKAEIVDAVRLPRPSRRCLRLAGGNER